jgi:hypothetical protein
MGRKFRFIFLSDNNIKRSKIRENTVFHEESVRGAAIGYNAVQWYCIEIKREDITINVPLILKMRAPSKYPKKWPIN